MSEKKLGESKRVYDINVLLFSLIMTVVGIALIIISITFDLPYGGLIQTIGAFLLGFTTLLVDELLISSKERAETLTKDLKIDEQNKRIEELLKDIEKLSENPIYSRQYDAMIIGSWAAANTFVPVVSERDMFTINGVCGRLSIPKEIINEFAAKSKIASGELVSRVFELLPSYEQMNHLIAAVSPGVALVSNMSFHAFAIRGLGLPFVNNFKDVDELDEKTIEEFYTILPAFIMEIDNYFDHFNAIKDDLVGQVKTNSENIAKEFVELRTMLQNIYESGPSGITKSMINGVTKKYNEIMESWPSYDDYW